MQRGMAYCTESKELKFKKKDRNGTGDRRRKKDQEEEKQKGKVVYREGEITEEDRDKGRKANILRE